MSSDRHAWRREPRERLRWRAARFYLGLVGVLGLALTAVFALATLLKQPFQHPKVQFVFLTGADLSGNLDSYFNQPGIAYPAEELAGMTRARESIFGTAAQGVTTFERWSSPNDTRFLGQKLIGLSLTANDVVLIDIVAAGISVDREAQLCWNFGRTEAARIRVIELLQQIIGSTPACKVVFLDAGNVESLSQEGMLVNDFSQLLQKAVQNTRDPNLWVICSHGPFESSQVIEPQRRSVFGYYLEQGLTGAADLNRDHQIDVGELHVWLSHSVSAYIDRRSGGSQSQTPQLYWGGHTPVAEREFPVVVPVRPLSASRDKASPKPKNSEQNSAPESEPKSNADSGKADSSSGSPPQELISEAWNLTEKLKSRPTDAPTAIDLAPRLMRELSDRLKAYEVLSQEICNVSPGEVANRLLPLVVPLREISAHPEVVPATTASGLGTRLVRSLAPVPLPMIPIRSLALAEFLAERKIQPLPEGFSELGTRLDKFITQDERTEFDEWVAKLNPAQQSLAELQGIQQIAQIPDVNWPLLKELLAVRRIGERTAVRSVGCLGIVETDIHRADRERLEGEAFLLDGVRPGRNQQASVKLHSASAVYRSAEHRLKEHTQSVQLKNELLLRAREYVNWRYIAALRSDRVAPEFEHVADFLTVLRIYCERIERQAIEDEVEIKDLASHLRERKQQIEATASIEFLQTLASSAIGPEEIAQIEALLETSFVAADLRSQLRQARLAAVSAVSLEAIVPELPRAVETPRFVLQRRRECLSQQLHLEWLLVQLSEIPEIVRSRSMLPTLTQAAESIQKRQQECIEHPGNPDRLFEWWQASHVFDRELKSWNRQLPERLREMAASLLNGDHDAAVAARGWRSVTRILSSVESRGNQSAPVDELVAQVQLAEWRELMSFLSRRASAAIPDATPQKEEYWQASSEFYRQAALAISAIPAIPLNPTASLRLSGESELQLSHKKDVELLVTIKNRRNVSQNVWITVDYDQNLLNIKDPVDYTIFRESASFSSGDPGSRQPPRSEVARHEKPPSLTLEPVSQRVLKFGIRNLASREWSTKFIVKASSENCDVRYECRVQTPAPEFIELLVDGPAGSWTATPTGFQLHPFPNQRTVFRFFLKNQGVPRTLDLALFPLDRHPEKPLPTGTITKEDAEALFRDLSLGNQLSAIAGFQCDADQKPHAVSLPGPRPPETDKTPPTGKDEALAGIAELPFGALFVITEPTTGKKMVKHLEFAPQRPRRYVAPRVDYQPDSQTIDVAVSRRENAVTPAEIKVHCEFGGLEWNESPPRTATGKMAQGQNEIRFSFPVPNHVQKMPLAIAIDDYPRAFRYQISSRLPGGQVAEDNSSLAIRVTMPDPQVEFACPRKAIDAIVHVDAPPGNQSEPYGYWEAGVDKSRDRELVGDTVVRHTNDRQARPKLSGYFPDGGLAIDTIVSDFHIPLSTQGICNQRALIIAHASFSGRQVWSDPIDIILDGTGPRVTNLTVSSDRPIVGEELPILATVEDGELSGVAKVEVAFDLAATGKFAKEPAPVLAARGADGIWLTKLSTEKMIPGSYTILIRATDKVGNEGEYRKIVASLVSKESLERQQATLRFSVRGVVTFKDQPVSDVKVVLVAGAEADPKAAAAAGGAADKSAGNGTADTPRFEPVQSDTDGAFVFKNVPPGKFKLKAEGIVRNKTRKVDLEITVDEKTKSKTGIQLKLP